MNRYISSVIALIISIITVGATKPIYVGHRGSAWGVENTLAAFVNGAKHYKYLECDIRMTADSVFVISHDESTERVGGKLIIAESPADALAAENYLQERNGIAYAGRIATFEEYLETCAKYNVSPLIEFKWTPGINSKDCSMIPELVKLLEKHGFRNSCIILTSMKPCLEFVMENYPDINVQFLGGGKWRDSLDWILKHKIDVDLMHTAVTKEDVDMLHDKGLKVNVWTIDNPERAAELTEMGVDFITTNKLIPAE